MISILDYIKLGLAAAIVAALAGGWWYVDHLQSEVKTLQDNNAKLELGIQQQQVLIDQMQRDVTAIQRINQTLTQQSEKQKVEVDALRKRFDEHDLGRLAAAKPALIEAIVNRGSRDAARCAELATGAVPKPGEKNTQCPTLIKGAK